MDLLPARRVVVRAFECASASLFLLLILFGVLLPFFYLVVLATIGFCLSCFWLVFAETNPALKKLRHFAMLFAAFFVPVLILVFGAWSQDREIDWFEAYLFTNRCTYSHLEMRDYAGELEGSLESSPVRVYECANGERIDRDSYGSMRPK